MRTRLRILGAVVATSVAAVAVPLLTSSDADAARFTIDNLVVYRVGSGAPLSNAAAPVFLDEYTQAGGAPVQSIALPTGPSDGNAALTASGLSRSEGLISRSADGKYLAITGYDAGVGATGPAGASLTASAPGTVARVVGLVDANGIADTSTSLTAAGAPKIIRSALTDGDRIWATGGNGGILTTTLGSGTSSTVAGTAASNFNSLTAQGGQLFASGILANRVTKVGSGFPAAGATPTDVPGLPTNLLAYGYAFFNLTGDGWAGTDLDTLYLANASNKGGTLDKYRYNGTTWTLAQSKDVPGISGLVASLNTGNVSIAATTPTALVKVLDTGAAGTATLGTPSTLASAPAGTEFRGVALAPTGTPGPSAYVRSPATGKTVNISSSGVPVSVYAKSPSGAVTGVTLTIGSQSVNATKGSGDVWNGTIPNTGLTVRRHHPHRGRDRPRWDHHGDPLDHPRRHPAEHQPTTHDPDDSLRRTARGQVRAERREGRREGQVEVVQVDLLAVQEGAHERQEELDAHHEGLRLSARARPSTRAASRARSA